VLLLDNSAWTRVFRGALDPQRAEAIASAIDRGEIAVCLPFLLEAGYSARSGADHNALMADLQELPRVEVTATVERSAIRAQAQLAQIGHHRLPPADLIIAAGAHQARAGVLHYDRDYDLIAEHTDLVFESRWLAPAGTL
jgi:predicted nucleic acid-binding protein